jgi:HEAT repeat protein
MVKVLTESSMASHRDKAERTLKAMLNDFVPEVRIAAIQALIDLGDPEAIRRLVVFMEDDDDEVRMLATIGIENLMHEGMSQELIDLILERERLLLDDTVERIRQSELMILGKIANEKAAEVILRALVDDSLIIRDTAITAFKQLGELGIKALQEASHSLKPLLSQNAMIALSELGHDKYRDALIDLMREELLEIYQHHSFIHGLSIFGTYPSFAVLQIYFMERNQQILDNIFYVMQTIYDTDAVLTIRDALQSSQSQTRLNAVEALEAIASHDITRQIATLSDPDIDHKTLSYMYYDMQGYEGDSDEQIVMRMATSDHDWVRAVSIMALGEIAADNDNIRRIILEDESILPVDNDSLLPHQKAVNPDLVSVTIKGALASKNPDVKHTAEAALRLIKGESVLDARERHSKKEFVAVISTIERMIYLKRIPFFQKLSVDQLKALAKISIEEVYKQGSLIFSEGDKGGSLYMVVTGRVEVGLMNRERNTFTMLAQYEGNTEFGEMSLFDGQPRSADAIAKEDTVVLTLHREPFLALTRQYPDLAIHMITTLSDRLRHANEQIARLNSTMPQTLDV